MDLSEKSKTIRRKTLEYHEKQGWGHVGSSMSIIEILTSLYYHLMKPEDKFILSKGHAAPALYVTLNEKNILSTEKMLNWKNIRQ